MAKLGMKDWAEEQMRRKWRWGGHTFRREDGRWSTRLAAWTPEGGQRSRGHPCARWSDDIVAFMVHVLDDGDTRLEHCLQIAAERNLWASLEDHYVRFCSQGTTPEIKDGTRTTLRGLRGTR